MDAIPTKQKKPKPMFIRMDSIEQPIETQLNPRAVEILESILLLGSTVFYCPGHNIFYKDSSYKIPVIKMDMLQTEFGIKEPEDVISALESLGYFVHSDPCFTCVTEQRAEA